jgi:hypothetical protein
MSVVARRIVSTPVRSASETWRVITDLLAPSEGESRRELSRIHGVACSLISSEAPVDDAIVIWGAGPRVRVYCLFGENAITGDDKAENALASCPTDGDWSMSLPCPEEDLVWVEQQLAVLSKRVSARKLGDSVPDEKLEAPASAEGLVDKGAFFRS